MHLEPSPVSTSTSGVGSLWGGQGPGVNLEQLLRGGETLAGEPDGDTGFRVLG